MAKKTDREKLEAKVGRLEQRLAKLNRTQKALVESEKRYRALFESVAEGIAVADIETRRFRHANPALCRMLGYTEEELQSMSVDDLHPKKGLKRVLSEFEAQARGEKTLAEKVPCLRKDGSVAYMNINTTKVLVNGAECNVGFFTDVTQQLQAMGALREKQAALAMKTKEFKEVNRALRALLKQRDEDKTEIEEKVVANVKELVLPYIEKLDKSRLDARSLAYLSILKSNLKSIVSPFAHSLSSKFMGLTPKEIQIAHLIREGRTTKELAALLNVSKRTVESHRQNIRTKIGITNRKINLRSYLMSM